MKVWLSLLLLVTISSVPASGFQPAEARRVGLSANGSQWGAMGERIDVRSGNLNYTIPLVQAACRGWGKGFGLSYNSQQWKQQGTTSVKLGQDLGYGFGWTLMAGSIRPDPVSSPTKWIFSDSSGAEYWLDINVSGTWSSRDGVHFRYDSGANRVWFNDGTFWDMGSTAGAGEPDAGTRYPTLIQDSNGNQLS